MLEMMINFVKKHKYACLWTAGYVMGMWIILKFLFNFNMFSGRQWHHLMHAQLHGFPGFVFGLLLLAAVPLYVATTTLIVRTGKPLFTFPMPAIFKPAPAPEKTADTPAPPAPAAAAPLPQNLPGELRGAFLRARQNMPPAAPTPTTPDTPTPDAPVTADIPVPAPEPVTAPTTPETSPIPAPAPASAAPTAAPTAAPIPPAPPSVSQPTTNGLPLPADFNFDDTPSSPMAAPFSSAPVFSDITFDDAPVPAAGADTTPPPAADAPKPAVAVFLESRGDHTPQVIADDIVIYGDMAIATHDDPEFWIADDPDWFAAGNQKKSPAAAVLAVARARDLKPVLYLGAQNIMDLDAKRATWQNDGIRVVTDLADL